MTVAISLFLAVTVVLANDPLAEIQLLDADVRPRNGGIEVCVQGRNDGPRVINGVQISGSTRSGSGGLTSFFTGVPVTTGVPPGDEFHACVTVDNIRLDRNATVQIAIQ